MRPQWREDCIVRALQNSNEYDVLVQISEFDGGMESKELLYWFDSIGSYFDWKEVPKERKVKLVRAKLRRVTFTWWKHYQNDREMRSKGKKKKRNWSKMKDKLKAQYLP